MRGSSEYTRACTPLPPTPTPPSPTHTLTPTLPHLHQVPSPHLHPPLPHTLSHPHSPTSTKSPLPCSRDVNLVLVGAGDPSHVNIESLLAFLPLLLHAECPSYRNLFPLSCGFLFGGRCGGRGSLIRGTSLFLLLFLLLFISWEGRKGCYKSPSFTPRP